jgi:probable HAF family extracellular repeat protein
MRRTMLLACVAAVGVALVSGASGSVRARWVIRDLGTLGGRQSVVAGINGRGQVVGWSTTAGGLRHAFLWEKGRMRDLGALPGDRYSEAVAINDRGQVVGNSWNKGDAPYHLLSRAFLWENGRMRDLGSLPGHSYSEAVGINERGQVVGNSWSRWLQDQYELSRAFLWEGGRIRGLWVLPSHRYSEAVAINERGQVIGNSWGKWHTDLVYWSPVHRAFLWEKGRITDLGALFRYETEVYGINDRGQVVGINWVVAGDTVDYQVWRAFIWQSGRMRSLGTLGGRSSSAAAINERGQVVGWADLAISASPHEQVSHAFVWENGRMADLGTPAGSARQQITLYAEANNDRGEIVGTFESFSTNWVPLPFLWQNGKMLALPTLPQRYDRYEVKAISSNSPIIGSAIKGDGVPARAVLWSLRSD